MRVLTIFALLLLLQACKHPLAIEGEGDIVERLAGERGCTLEEFQAASPRCFENEVIDADYTVSYQGMPKPGWRFDRWEEGGTACSPGSVAPYCEYSVPAAAVTAMDEIAPEIAFPATKAVFVESDVDSDFADFSAVDARLESFIAAQDGFDGTSIIVVSKEGGIIHEAAFGDHALGSVVLLASTSKVPSVSLIMALANDPELDFDIDTPIENYLPWEGVYPGRTVAQLVSNTSGIPSPLSLENPALLGLHSCQFVPFAGFPFADNLLNCNIARGSVRRRNGTQHRPDAVCIEVAQELFVDR